MISVSGVRSLQDNCMPKSREKLPKSLSLFFLMLAFVFGLDLGFIKYFNKKIRGVAKGVSVIISLIIILILLAPVRVDNQDKYWIVISCLTYLLSFIAISCSKCKVYEFLLDIHNIDVNILCGNQIKISVCVWLYSFFLYSTKWAMIYCNCEVLFPERCDFGLVSYRVFGVPALGVDLIYVALILIYCYMYYSIKQIRALYEKDQNISLLKKQYTAIAKCYDRICPFYEKVIIVLLIMDLPKLMGLLYNMVKRFVVHADLLGGFGEYVYAYHIMSNITAAGTMVQMVVWQVDALIVCLLDELIDEQDTKKREQISNVVEYLKTRKLWHPLVGVVPVDMGLPSFVLSVCSTYLIVMIQFTHLVD